MKTLIYIKAHVFSEELIIEYEKLKKTGFDVLIVFDNNYHKYQVSKTSDITLVEISGKQIPVLFTDLWMFIKFKLPGYYDDKDNLSVNRFMWYNADYQLYIVSQLFPDYDFYWQMEYDVFCNGKSYKKFFDIYSDNKADLLATRFAKTKPTWWATKKTRWIYKKDTELGCCILPIIRVSKAGAKYLYKRRLEHGEKYLQAIHKKRTRWVFCECFVATEIGIHKKLIGEPIYGQYIEPPDKITFNLNKVLETPDNKLYHPVKRIHPVENVKIIN